MTSRREWVADHLRAHCFGGGGPLRFGAEMELLAFDASTGAVAPILSPASPSTLPAVRVVAERLAWREGDCAKGVPRYVAPSGGALTFEPGGQLEYATAAHASVDAVLDELRTVHDVLVAECGALGVRLESIGVDPRNGPSDAPLQLDAERYRRMSAYFATIGPAGARMMRQTASVQLCVGGVDVADRWHAANAIVPCLVALFANSRRYAGRDTGYASYRAETWRAVDPARTGIVTGDDPVTSYANFALRAPAFLAVSEGERAVPFAELPDDRATAAALGVHLSTLFPEVRPRGYLELRSADAIGVEHHAGAMAFVAGLLADQRASREALELVQSSGATALLDAAARFGLEDARLARCAAALVELALDGCGRLGPEIVSGAVLERARHSFAELLRRSVGTRDHEASSSPTAVLGPEVRSSRCLVSSDVWPSGV